MPRSLPGIAALAIGLLAGCAGDGPPGGEPLLVISGPEAFESFELRGHGDELIWLLVADEPVPLEHLVYGQVPSGFRQETPAAGLKPRPLMAGEPLHVRSVTPRRVFRHWGFAESESRLSLDSWEMRLREPPEPAALDGTPSDP